MEATETAAQVHRTCFRQAIRLARDSGQYWCPGEDQPPKQGGKTRAAGSGVGTRLFAQHQETRGRKADGGWSPPRAKIPR